ncbi:MAG: alpha/beta fold hydrolase [Acidimicrobiales bacterium]
MKVILVPGLWLDASSWDGVVPALAAAGHDVEALTLPGLESADADRSGLTLRDHVDAVIARIDEAAGPVVLVGHSGGGSVISGAADARPDRVGRAIYVDSGPAGEGGIVNDELPAVNGEIPLPDWDAFDNSDLIDLDDELRAAFRARAIPSPLHVAIDPQHVDDDRRYDVPTTVIASSIPGAMLREFIAKDHPYVRELSKMRDYEVVDLPTGHWPQFTKPAELAAAILTAIDRS